MQGNPLALTAQPAQESLSFPFTRHLEVKRHTHCSESHRIRADLGNKRSQTDSWFPLLSTCPHSLTRFAYSAYRSVGKRLGLCLDNTLAVHFKIPIMLSPAEVCSKVDCDSTCLQRLSSLLRYTSDELT
jgi:hypothetical protein